MFSRSSWAIPLPSGLSAPDAAKIGTAGYTAMLCVQVRHAAFYLNSIAIYTNIILGLQLLNFREGNNLLVILPTVIYDLCT